MYITIDFLKILIKVIQKELKSTNSLPTSDIIIENFSSQDIELGCLKLFEMDMIECNMKHSINRTIPEMEIIKVTDYGIQFLKK